MVKCEVIGMLDIAKINPVLTSENDVTNYSFLTVDDIDYVIFNDINGDDSYKDDVTIKAGEYLNGYQLAPWVGQKLVVDGKHITGGVADLEVGATLVIGDDGLLKAGTATGIGFKVTDKVTLTEAAVKVVITQA